MTILLFLLWHSGTPVIRRSRSAVFALRGVVDADAPPSDKSGKFAVHIVWLRGVLVSIPVFEAGGPGSIPGAAQYFSAKPSYSFPARYRRFR